MPEFNSSLGLEDASSVKKSEVGGVTPDYKEIKRKILLPYAECDWQPT